MFVWGCLGVAVRTAQPARPSQLRGERGGGVCQASQAGGRVVLLYCVKTASLSLVGLCDADVYLLHAPLAVSYWMVQYWGLLESQAQL
jgi:hypothetical protein